MLECSITLFLNPAAHAVHPHKCQRYESTLQQFDLTLLYFYQYSTRRICTHKNGNLLVLKPPLQNAQKCPVLHKVPCFCQENRFSCFPREDQFNAERQGNAATDFIFAALIMLNSSTLPYWLSTGGRQPFQALRVSHADIMLYSSTMQQIHESSRVCINEAPAQRPDSYILVRDFTNADVTYKTLFSL